MAFGGDRIVMKGLLLGTDLGTTALKAAAFDARTGRPVACASVRLPVRTDASGAREQDPAALRRVLASRTSLPQDVHRRSVRVGLGLLNPDTLAGG
jgi:ribulose kinase